MKELSTEEKAKRYDEALERATNHHNNDGLTLEQYETIDIIFPELRESEDKKIRTRIIALVNAHGQGMYKDEMLAWVEKQGKFKFESCIQEGDKIITNADGTRFNISQLKRVAKKEPRFKVGDWVIYECGKDSATLEIKNIVDGSYEFTDDSAINVVDENTLRLWTIKDAKDGDVLVYGDNPADHHLRIIMLFKSMRTFNSAFNHFHIFDDEFRINDWCDCGKTAHPATKEQRDLLFQKMKEAGYEWDVEKKELRKIEQKPAWSEEDEGMLNSFLHKLEVCTLLSNKEIIWIKNKFKSLKDRVQPQPQEQWSEKDEIMIGYIINDIETVKQQVYSKTLCDEEISWLKSLRPQNRWKPSDEQMKALADALSLAKSCGEEGAFDLRTLYEQLKKLMEK